MLSWTMWKAALNESSSPSWKARTMWRIGNPPIQSINGVVQGLQVKVCQKILADHMYALLRKPEHAVMNLICVYFIPEWCNVAFEIIDVDCKDGEPKQECFLTPLEDMDEDTLFNVEIEM